jgi:ABC-type glycerol-3-phosphate transport system substrate-binding protein
MVSERKLSRRQFLSTVGLVLAGTAVAACAPKTEEVVVETVVKEVEKVVKETVIVEGTPKVVEKVVKETVIVEPMPAPKERVTVKFWYGWATGAEADALQEMCGDAMEMHPEILVDNLPGAGWGLDQKVLTALAGGAGPDIFCITNEGLDAAYVKRIVAPLSEYIEASTRYGLDSLNQQAWDLVTRDGVINVMPFNYYCYSGLYYNKSMLAEAGLPTDHGPETLQELFEWNEKLTIFDASGNLVRVGYMPTAAAAWNADPWAGWFNTQYYDPATKKLTLDNPEWVEVMEWLVSFSKFFGAARWSSWASTYTPWMDAPNAAFPQELLAMVVEGPWAVKSLMKWNPDLLETTGLGWHPTKDQKKYQVWATWGGLLCSASRHKEEAWLLLEHLCSYEGQKTWHDHVGGLVPQKQLAAEIQAEETDPMALWWWQTPDQQERSSFARCPLWSEVIIRLGGALSQIVAEGIADIEAVMSDMQADLQPQLDAMLSLMA